MRNPVTTEDYSAINDFLARYFRYVDANQPDEWVNLWTDDGTFLMTGSDALVGREALKYIPRLSFEKSGGKMIHMFSNLFCDYGETRDAIIAEFYELVTNWRSGGAFQAMALCKATVVRDGATWRMKRNDVTMLR
jgi:hypothetical protein